MDKLFRPRKIDVLVFNDVNILDVGGPVQAFESAYFADARAYSHRFVSMDGKPVRASCGLMIQPDAALDTKSTADDLMIPGGRGVDALMENPKLQTVIQSWQSKSKDGRLISICSGSLLLAASGVLNGQKATTHWARARMVESRFPKVLWDLESIYTMSPRIYTSAGVSTGIDLALAIIKMDVGPSTALEAAQELVVFLKRSGNQNQFSKLLKSQYDLGKNVSALVEAIISHPDRNWTLDEMASEALMNSRTLSRQFKKSIGVSPVQFVEQIRIEHARGLIADGQPLKKVATRSGFGDLQRMRRSFQRTLGTNVSDYVERFSSTS